MASFYDEIAANKRNSYFLMAIVFALVAAMVYAFSSMFFYGSDVAFYASLAFAAVYIAVTYFFADKLILSLAGAREAQKGEFPYLVNVVEGLSMAAGVPAPKIYVVDDPGLNAFATGISPDKASVVFTTGLLSSMNRAELEGVAAHEISHIKNYDSKMATLVVIMVGLMALISDFGLRSMFWGKRGGGRSGKGEGVIALFSLLIIILAPILAQVVRLALSRQREYLADATGAQLTRYPEGLASALEKIKKIGAAVQNASETTASLYFANPLTVGQLFSTHPPIDERISRLRAM